MARKIIDIGVQGNDGTGDSIREAFRKVNENFTDLYAIFNAETQVKSTELLDDFPNVYQTDAILITDPLGENVLSKKFEQKIIYKGLSDIDIHSLNKDELKERVILLEQQFEEVKEQNEKIISMMSELYSDLKR